VLDVALQVPQQLPRNKILRTRFLSYLHRMVECLGTCILPFLPRAFETLLHDQCDAGDIGDVVRLILQLLAAFPSQIEEQISVLLPSVIMRCASPHLLCLCTRV
jgi:exportin-T